MKRFGKKTLICITLSLLLMLSATGCGKSGVSEQGSQGADNVQGGNIGLANPWRDITEDEAYAAMANLFCAPKGAENVRWSMMGDPEYPSIPGAMVQMDFDLNGMNFTAREQYVSDEKANISGCFYEWNESLDTTLANWGGGQMPAKIYRYRGDGTSTDVCTWYDTEIGAAYSLSVSYVDPDGFDIQAVAESLYDPAKQFGANAPDEDHEPMDITGCSSFDDIIGKLNMGNGYAKTRIAGTDVLLVSSETYELDLDGEHCEAISADVYQYAGDGSLVYLGYAQSGGTAYPLAIDSKGLLYAGRNHGMAKMTISGDRLVTDEEVYVLYDVNGNATYYHTSDTGKAGEATDVELPDDTMFKLFFDDYMEAEEIEFDSVT